MTNVWNGRRVLVTGHTGFKGTWLTLWLESRGAVVTGLALDPPSQPNMFDLVRAGRGIRDLRGDVRDAAAVARAFSESRAEVVFHLAAQSLVRASYDDPLTTYATNVMGTATVLDAARRSDHVQAIVVVTSDKCYENRDWVWGYRETDPMGGHDPYSNSKGCAELVTAAFRASYFHASGAPAVASARAGNVIGGGDWAADRLVPDAITAFAAGQPLQVRNPRAVRPWQHVVDPLAGYLLLAERLCGENGRQFAEGWNFGPAAEDARPVAEVVDKMVGRWGASASWQQDPRSHPHEAQLLSLDASKARRLLGWQPRLTIDDAVDWTIDWYRAWAANGDLRALTLSQLEAYAA